MKHSVIWWHLTHPLYSAGMWWCVLARGGACGACVAGGAWPVRDLRPGNAY